MCIICIKPTNTKDFSDEVLKHCWEKNDDGAGFAYWDSTKNLWSVKKGYLTYKKFIHAYRAQQFTENDVVIVHFRIGTSGLKDKGNTHPFIICDDYRVMRQREYESENIAFHNGVVGKGDGDFSDTMVHVRDYLFPIFPLWDDERIQSGIASTLLEKNSSRWVVCVKETYYLFGTFHEYNGWKFSNTNYKPWTQTNTVFHVNNFNSRGNHTIYDDLKDANKLPLGNWNYGIKARESGFWKGNDFTSWDEYAKSINFIPPFKSPKGDKEPFFQNGCPTIKNEEDFCQRYVLTSASKAGLCLTVFNFKVFAMDLSIQRKKKAKEEEDKKALVGDFKSDQIMTAMLDDDGSFAWDGKDEDEMTDELKDFKMCPHCFSDLIGESPFTIGDSICMICGCVFVLATGDIQTFDQDINKKYLLS